MTIPLTLIGGYLGSGKTTLINSVLSSPKVGRTAVVVNDFGEVNVDSALIAATGADTMELTNGCICCQITDDVQRTMSTLAARTDIDQVLCEVSGIGDPAQLGTWRTFPGFYPGPIVICADALVTPRRLTDEFIADVVDRQIAAADLVLVTKADLATTEQVEATADACAQIARNAEIDTLTNGSFASLPDRLGRWKVDHDRRDQAEEAAPHGIGAAHSDVHRTVTVQLSAEVQAEAVESVLTHHVDRLSRAKGFARDANRRWRQLHLAGGTVSRSPLPTGAVAPSQPEIVLIAAGTNAEQSLATAGDELRALSQRAPSHLTHH